MTDQNWLKKDGVSLVSLSTAPSTLVKSNVAIVGDESNPVGIDDSPQHASNTSGSISDDDSSDDESDDSLSVA